MNISSRPSFHNVCSTVLLGTALFMGGEFETVKATTFALGETLEASAPTFSPVEPVTLEQKETLEAKLPALTAKVMISFCEEEMKVKFSEEEKVKITQRLTQFFKKSPICCIENGKIKLLMTATYTDAAAKELMPYFVNKVDWWLKIGYDVGSFFGGHDNMNAYVWRKIKKHLKNLKATEAKNTFIKDIWSAFKKLNKAVWDSYKAETGEEISFTIGHYLTTITSTFPNLDMIEFQKTPAQDLNLSISTLDHTKRY